jgi:hypothetical protein
MEDDSAHLGSARLDDRAVTLRSVIEIGSRGPGAEDVSGQAHPRDEGGLEMKRA